jgi:hypothetical protein
VTRDSQNAEYLLTAFAIREAKHKQARRATVEKPMNKLASEGG